MKSQILFNLIGNVVEGRMIPGGKSVALSIAVILLGAIAAVGCSSPSVEPSDIAETRVPAEPSRQAEPTEATDLILLGARHLEDGNLLLAIDVYSEAVAADTEFVEAYVARAGVYMLLGQIDEAMADLDHALAVDPEYMEAYLSRGMAYSLVGNFDAAIENFDRSLPALDKTIQADPELATAYFSRGVAHFFMMENELAIADFDRTVEINPEYLEAYAIRGNAYDNMGDFEAALADYAKVLSLNPDDSQRALVLLDRGQAYARRGFIDRATADLEEALSLGLHPAAVEEAEFTLEFLAGAEGSEEPDVEPAQAWELPYSDDFSDPTSGWEIGEYAGGTVGYENGVYVVTSTVIEGNMWAIASQSFEDVEITVRARQVSGPANNNNGYGVACRVGQGLAGYFFLISGDGFFSIFRAEQENSNALVPWTETNLVRKGNSFNDIRAICNGEELSFFINEGLAASVQDSALNSGDVALSAITFEDEVTEIHFDFFEVKLP